MICLKCSNSGGGDMSKKTKRILLGIYIVALFSIVSSATLAYFTYVEVSNVSPSIKSTTATIMDWLIFDIGKPIYIYADNENFGEGMSSLSDETIASANLRVVNNEGRNKTYYYNVLLNIKNNEFSYSTNSNIAELLIKIYNPDGEEVKEMEGLNYTTSDGYSGFDITTASGEYYIAQNYEITTNDEIEQNWQVEVIFVNLDTSQDINAGVEFDAALEMKSVYTIS